MELIRGAEGGDEDATGEPEVVDDQPAAALTDQSGSPDDQPAQHVSTTCAACQQDTGLAGACRLLCFWWSNAGQCRDPRSCHYAHSAAKGSEIVLAAVCDMSLFVTTAHLETTWWPHDEHFCVGVSQLGEPVARQLLAGCNNGMIVRAGGSLRFPASCMLRGAPGVPAD